MSASKTSNGSAPRGSAGPDAARWPYEVPANLPPAAAASPPSNLPPYAPPLSQFSPTKHNMALQHPQQQQQQQQQHHYEVPLLQRVDPVIEDTSFWLRIGPLRFNPIVTLLAVIIVWAFIGGCLHDPETADANFKVAKVRSVTLCV